MNKGKKYECKVRPLVGGKLEPGYDGFAHVGDPPAPFWGGHQHDPGLARTRVAGNDERVRGSGPGDESQSVGRLRGGRGRGPGAVEGGRGANGVPAEAVGVPRCGPSMVRLLAASEGAGRTPQ